MNLVQDDAERGLYEKYVVTRKDGQSRSGGRHAGCRYFVLDLTHDPHATAALLAYADSCEEAFPQLARDLREAANLGPKEQERLSDLVNDLVREADMVREIGPSRALSVSEAMALRPYIQAAQRAKDEPTNDGTLRGIFGPVDGILGVRAFNCLRRVLHGEEPTMADLRAWMDKAAGVGRDSLDDPEWTQTLLVEGVPNLGEKTAKLVDDRVREFGGWHES